MSIAKTSVGEIFRRHGDEFLSKYRLPAHWLKAIEAIKLCRTAELGGHVEKCICCGHTKVHYNNGFTYLDTAIMVPSPCSLYCTGGWY